MSIFLFAWGLAMILGVAHVGVVDDLAQSFLVTAVRTAGAFLIALALEQWVTRIIRAIKESE